MITVNKEILMNPDFMNDFASELCEMLEALIDAEFEKGDETDFDFIDECAEAINAIRTGDNAQILPLVSRKDFLEKLGVKTERRFSLTVAACAAIALILAASAVIKTEENISVLEALTGIVSEFFTNENQVEETSSQPETTTEKAYITDIIVQTSPEFKTEYTVGEKFSSDGLAVFAKYSNGEKMIVENYSVELSESFATQPKYETVKISFGGFTHSVEVRVIESLETKKLTSIYAIFPDDYNFTAENLDGFDRSIMQVYAVYSNGEEKELSADEYSVTEELDSSLFESCLNVTVEYEGCSCSFMVFKE